jgi:hypothetical protein
MAEVFTERDLCILSVVIAGSWSRGISLDREPNSATQQQLEAFQLRTICPHVSSGQLMVATKEFGHSDGMIVVISKISNNPSPLFLPIMGQVNLQESI